MVEQPRYDTFGASINKITIQAFKQKHTIGDLARARIAQLREQFACNPDDIEESIIRQLNDELGDSIEKIAFMQQLLGIEDDG